MHCEARPFTSFERSVPRPLCVYHGDLGDHEQGRDRIDGSDDHPEIGLFSLAAGSIAFRHTDRAANAHMNRPIRIIEKSPKNAGEPVSGSCVSFLAVSWCVGEFVGVVRRTRLVSGGAQEVHRSRESRYSNRSAPMLYRVPSHWYQTATALLISINTASPH